MKTDEWYVRITEAITAEIDKGVAPWVKPWASMQIPWPANPITAKKFHGLNALVLDMTAMFHKTNFWATFNQIKDAGGMVRKNEKGTHILRPIEFKKAAANATGDEDEETRLGFIPFAVFNFSQADGLDRFIPPPVEIKPVERRPDIEAAIAGTGAKIVPHDSHCFYRPATDTIHMMDAGAFQSIDHAYATTFHELGHWTGAESRLKRDLTGTFKSHAYAGEELVAELTSAFACHHFGIDGLDRHHGSYLASWAKMFGDDKKAIAKAAGAASRAFSLIVPEARP